MQCMRRAPGEAVVTGSHDFACALLFCNDIGKGNPQLDAMRRGAGNASAPGAQWPPRHCAVSAAGQCHAVTSTACSMCRCNAVRSPSSAMRMHAGRCWGIAMRQPGTALLWFSALPLSAQRQRRASRAEAMAAIHCSRLPSTSSARRPHATAAPAMSVPPAAGRTGASSVVALLRSGSGARSATGSVCCRSAAGNAAHRRSGSVARRPLPGRVADWPAPGATRRGRSSASRRLETASSL